MLNLKNFSIAAKSEEEPKRMQFGFRPLREGVGTLLIRAGQRLGGRNRREEALKETAELLALDVALSKSEGTTFEGPFC